MSLVTVGGAPVLRGRIAMPLRGAWFGEFELDALEAPTGAVTVASDGGFSLSGAVKSSGVDDTHRAHVRVIGGAGGLANTVSGAFRSAQLRDALNAALAAGSESLSDGVDSDLLGLSLAYWTQGGHRVGRQLDDLAAAAGRALGESVGWRILEDGKVWMGSEAWPSESLPAGSVVERRWPADGRHVLAVDTLWLLPGVTLEGVGRVRAVEHWVEPGAVRSWAWT